MINNIIPLVSSMAPMWNYVLTFVMALAFVATVPCIIRKIVRIR